MACCKGAVLEVMFVLFIRPFVRLSAEKDIRLNFFMYNISVWDNVFSLLYIPELNHENEIAGLWSGEVPRELF